MIRFTSIHRACALRRTKASPLINVPQIISLAQAIVQTGEAVEAAPANEPVPVAESRDAIALGTAFAAGEATSLAQAAVTFGSEPGLAQAAPLPPAQVVSIISDLLRDLAATPNATAPANPVVAQSVTALVNAAVAGTVVQLSASAPLAALVALIRAAVLTAGTGGATALSAQVRAILSSDSGSIATALVSAAPQAANGANPPGALVPLYDPSLRSLAAPAPTKAPGATANDRPAALVPVPERDPYGRPYSERERRRLRQLGCDPRRGFAPEAETAVAAEERWNVTFARSLDPDHDFIDERGRLWDAVVPRSADGLGIALRALGARAGILLSIATCAPADREEVVAVVARCSADVRHPIVVVVVDGQTEIAWPG